VASSFLLGSVFCKCCGLAVEVVHCVLKFVGNSGNDLIYLDIKIKMLELLKILKH